jgi:hypothetical protein
MNVEESVRGLILIYCPDICLEGLSKTTKHLSQVAGLRAEIWTQDLPNTNHTTTTFGVSLLKLRYKVCLYIDLTLIFYVSKPFKLK